LQVTNVQLANSAYYVALAGNAAGWVPSKLAYLSVVDSLNRGIVPFSNEGNPAARAFYQRFPFNQPITNGTAQVIAGPALDEMQALAVSQVVTSGYFNGGTLTVPTVAPGQTVYYRVDISYPYNPGTFTQQSTVLKLTAGGGSFPVPPADNLKFPLWPEWPEPVLLSSPSANQVRIPGETASLTNRYFAYTDFGTPMFQWRKDGSVIADATNVVQISGGPEGGEYQTVLTLTNVQAANAGNYDVAALGNNWIVSPKITLSVQLAGGEGVFVSPRISGSNFVADFQGVPGRRYEILWSSNLSAWGSLLILSNVTGTVALTNASGSANMRFYRARLLPSL
jgi:hypothetical protein